MAKLEGFLVVEESDWPTEGKKTYRSRHTVRALQVNTPILWKRAGYHPIEFPAGSYLIFNSLGKVEVWDKLKFEKTYAEEPVEKS